MAADAPSESRKLTFGQADEDSPSTSADGRWLVYTDNRENATAIILRDLNTGDEKALSVSRLDFGEQGGTVRVVIVEKGTNRPLVACLSLQQRAGKYFAPIGALYRIHGDLEDFYASHEAEMVVPAGKYVLRAFRGLEYRTTQREFDVAPNQSTTVQLELERWTNPASDSWYSGESHIHANYGYGQWYNTPETVRLQMEGEGLGHRWCL